MNVSTALMNLMTLTRENMFYKLYDPTINECFEMQLKTSLLIKAKLGLLSPLLHLTSKIKLNTIYCFLPLS